MYWLWNTVGTFAGAPLFLALLVLLTGPSRREARLRREHEKLELQREYLGALEARERLRAVAASAASAMAHWEFVKETGLLPVDEDGNVQGVVIGDPHFQHGHTCVEGYCPHYPVKRQPTPVYEPCEQHREYEPGFKARGLIVRHRSGV